MDERSMESNVSQILNDEIFVDDENIVIEKQENPETGEAYVYMPSGEALSIQGTYSIMAKEITRLIVVIGPFESGKTTLETTLYQMFQSGKLEDFYFAGSKTLQGYEERAFLTRINSGRTKPDTPRTTNGIPAQFLHIRVYNVKEGIFYNLLFADIAGEDYDSCLADSDEMKRQFPYFINADFFVALIDGKELKDRGKRFSLPENLKLMFRTIVDANLCKRESRLQVVTSKYDLVDDGTENSNEVIDFLAQNRERLSKYLEKYFPTVEFFNIAAMPDVNEKYRVGFGVDNLLVTWCRKGSFLNNAERNIRKDLKAEFNKLSYKLLEN